MRRWTVVLLFVMVACCVAAWAQSGERQQDANAVEVTDEITPPRLLEVASPEYTDEAKKKRIEGDVIVSIIVDEKGRVASAKVKKGLGYGLDENAIAAVKEWTYKPAERDGKPVAVKMDVTTNFYLKN
ncbi:MAG TPA: energy transducer TonB [Clostridia bacterium]|nr:energy transducer TonB [Clostridia bacterium]